MINLAWSNLLVQLALGVKLHKINTSEDSAQNAADSFLPPDFQATWEMPGYLPSTMSTLLLSASSRQDPVNVSGKSIIVLGMVYVVNAGTYQGIDNLMVLCGWFEPGKCHVIVGCHRRDGDGAAIALEQKHQGRLEFAKDPPNLSPGVGTRRTWKYADIRNHLLGIGMKRNPTYIMAADLDGIVIWDVVTFGAITNVIAKYDDRWDGVAFSSDHYYDWWAARCSLESPNCVAVKPNVCYDMKYFQCVPDAQQQTVDSFTKVASAFNGLALYKTSQIGSCRYDGHRKPGNLMENTDLQEDCEHVALNNCLVRQGKRFMLSSLVASNTKVR